MHVRHTCYLRDAASVEQAEIVLALVIVEQGQPTADAFVLCVLDVHMCLAIGAHRLVRLHGSLPLWAASNGASPIHEHANSRLVPIHSNFRLLRARMILASRRLVLLIAHWLLLLTSEDVAGHACDALHLQFLLLSSDVGDAGLNRSALAHSWLRRRHLCRHSVGSVNLNEFSIDSHLLPEPRCSNLTAVTAVRVKPRRLTLLNWLLRCNRQRKLAHRHLRLLLQRLLTQLSELILVCFIVNRDSLLDT